MSKLCIDKFEEFGISCKIRYGDINMVIDWNNFFLMCS